MLSPIATVLFRKLRHLGQSDARATSPKPLSATSTPCMINILLNSGSPESFGMVLAVKPAVTAWRRRNEGPMSSEETATQPIMATSSPQPDVAAQLVPVCCVCGLIRDEPGSPPGHMSWVALRSYRKAHELHSTELLLTHTYCPDCLARAQARVREHFSSKRAEARTS